MQPDVSDVFTTVGAKPKVVFNIPIANAVPANGTAFKIWGYAFTVDNAQPFTSSSFRVGTNGLLTALNLLSMLQANLFFKRACVLSASVVGPNVQAMCEWKDCREQVNFTGANMNLAVFSSMGGSATATNGTSPVYVDGYRLIVNTVRYKDATSVFADLGELVGMEAEKLCTTVGSVCVDINNDVSADLYTMLPALTYSSFISSIDNGRSMMRYYSLQYGWAYRENCVAKSGTIKRAKTVLCINAALDQDDPYQMRRYWHDHPDGYPPGQSVVEFLTTQPKSLKLCRDSFKWLWILNNWKEDNPNYRLVARFYTYDKNGFQLGLHSHVINDPATMGSAPYQAVCFNASPRFISDVLGGNLTNVAYYEVQVYGVPTSGPLSSVLFIASELIRIQIDHSCCDSMTDLYFLSPTGSIDTMNVRIDSIETLQSDGQEIYVNVPCGASFVDRATNGGRTLINTRAYQKVKMSVKIPRRSDHERWVAHMRQSPQRWIKMRDASGTFIAKKIVFENGGITQHKVGEGAQIEMIGYLQDRPIQQVNERKF
ncbi:MAG: hypothetical protein ACRCVX_14255 [Shewanella sp.]